MVIGLGEALSLGCALTWAVGVIIYKRLGEQLPPLKLCLLKNLIVLALVVATVAVLGSPLADGLGLERLPLPALDTASVLLALASGVVGIAVADTLYLRALNVLGAGRMGVVGNLFSPFVILLSVAFLGERLGPLQWLGFALVMAGVVLVNAPDRMARIDPAVLRRGLATGALAVALMAVAIVMVKQVLEDEPFWWIVLLRVAGAVAGLLLLLAASPSLRAGLRGSGQPTRWGVLVVAALVGQYLSMAMWLGGYKYTDASVASVLNETASVFIVLFAAIFLGEALSRRRVAGVLVTLAGVACMV
jgi:drug/metabolite transporter (DMT)-like permease